MDRFGTGGSENTLLLIDGRNLSGDNWESLLRWTAVGSDFVRTMGMHLSEGRSFNENDVASAPKVVIVNERFVKRFLNGGNALGHRVDFWESPKLHPGEFTIVGVVANSKYAGVRDEEDIAYFPIAQLIGINDMANGMTFELRTAGEPLRLLPEVRRAVRAFGPDLIPRWPMTQQQQFDSSISQERLNARLALCFGLLAAVLVAADLYGTLAYTVSRRTAEIGLRMALGAARGEVIRIVIRRSQAAAAAGVAIGLPLALAGGRLLRAFLYGIAPEDPLTYLAALAGIVLVCAVASWVPARRAVSVDPVVALRYE
jgi:predicted permease